MTEQEMTAVMGRIYGAVAPWAELTLWLKECHAITGRDEKDFIAGAAGGLMISGLSGSKAGQK